MIGWRQTILRRAGRGGRTRSSPYIARERDRTTLAAASTRTQRRWISQSLYTRGPQPDFLDGCRRRATCSSRRPSWRSDARCVGEPGCAQQGARRRLGRRSSPPGWDGNDAVVNASPAPVTRRMRSDERRRQELIELSDLNFIEATRSSRVVPAAPSTTRTGLCLFAGKPPPPVLVNGVPSTGTAADGDGAGARERVLSPHADAVISVLAARIATRISRYRRSGGTAAVRRPAGDGPGAKVVGRRRRRVTAAAESDADARAFGEVMGLAYATLRHAGRVRSSARSARSTALRARRTSSFAQVDGQGRAGAMVIVTHGVAGIYMGRYAPRRARQRSRGTGIARRRQRRFRPRRARIAGCRRR